MTIWPRGVGRTVHDTIDSTNEEARRHVATGETGPIWIASRRQTAGRGRQGRGWATDPGNLAATYVERMSGGPQKAALLSFVAALAVADTLDALAPKADVSLKWPNDVLLNGGKACGILLEALAAPKPAEQVIAIGIGLNLLHHPPADQAKWPPTSVTAVTGTAPDFDDALLQLAAAMERRLARHRQDGFEATRQDWLGRAINLGRDIEVRLPRETLVGRFAGLDTTGALVLEHATGTRLIAAGDVFFPEAA